MNVESAVSMISRTNCSWWFSCLFDRSMLFVHFIYSADRSNRFSCLLFEYRTEFFLWNLSYSDFRFLVDHIFSQPSITKLSLSHFFIPCLTEHFSSYCQESMLSDLVDLQLDKCTFLSPSLLTWISNQSQLKTLVCCDDFSCESSPSTNTTRSLLRDFLFNNRIGSSLHTLHATLWPGFVLSDELVEGVITQHRYVHLDLHSFDDLCVLLDKHVLPNVSQFLIYFNRPRNKRTSNHPSRTHWDLMCI